MILGETPESLEEQTEGEQTGQMGRQTDVIHHSTSPATPSHREVARMAHIWDFPSRLHAQPPEQELCPRDLEQAAQSPPGSLLEGHPLSVPSRGSSVATTKAHGG